MTEMLLQEETIFGHALELGSDAEWAAYLDCACGANRTLRAEVEALLRADARTGDLLDLPEGPAAAPGLLGVERHGAAIIRNSRRVPKICSRDRRRGPARGGARRA